MGRVLGYVEDDPVWKPGIFSFLQNIYTTSGAHLTNYFMGRRSCFPGGKAAVA